MKKLGLACAFFAAMVGSSLVTAVVMREGSSHAQAPAPAPAPVAAPADEPEYEISAYMVDNKTLSNGFIVLNSRTGKVSNCIANFQGKKEGKCYAWDWVRLP